MHKKYFNNFITRNAYPLPWTYFDNPNGWIEPTKCCQLKCPGCYRGLDIDSSLFKHRNLKEMMLEVDNFIINRNVQTISIAGGEPLLYPKIYDLIKYISSKNLKSILYTNAIALNLNILNKLDKAGLTLAVLHIDRFQNVKNRKTDKDVMQKKMEFCNLFRETGNVNLGFIQPISKQNIDSIESQYDFYIKNHDIVSLVVFTIYRDLANNKKLRENIYISQQDLYKKLKKFRWRPCSYLESTEEELGPSWIFSISVFNNKRLLGFLNGRWYRKIHLRYRKYKKKYLFINKKNYFLLNRKIFFSLNLKYLFKIIINIIKNNSNRRIYFQTTLILKPPEKINNKISICKSCPDAMYYKGELMPSCLLERLKKNHYKFF